MTLSAVRSIIFDSTSTSSFGAYCISGTTAKTPERDVSVVEIPGRNGNLIVDNGRYKNREFTLTFGIRGDNVTGRAISFYDWLSLHSNNYYELSDPQIDGSYLMARVSSLDEPVFARMRTKDGHALLQVTFDAKPQRYLTIGDDWKAFTASGTIKNPTHHISQPGLRIYGTGSVQINDVKITVTTAFKPYFYIDTATMDTQWSNVVTITGGDAITLQPGQNSITLTNITDLEIEPRWWTL